MDSIIEKDIFITGNGTLTGKYSAQLVQLPNHDIQSSNHLFPINL